MGHTLTLTACDCTLRRVTPISSLDMRGLCVTGCALLPSPLRPLLMCQIGAGLEPGTQSKWLEEHHMKRRWMIKEEEMRKQMDLEKETALKLRDRTAGGLRNNSVKNIFSGAASSKVLSADLLTIIREQQSLGLQAEAVDDSIYHWKVQLEAHGFPGLGGAGGDRLAEDLACVESRWGYGYVELEIRFTIDLYPFFPPQVKVVRPRFQGFMLGQIASMRALQLSHWNSVGTMSSVLHQVKELLANHARVDFDSDRNDPTAVGPHPPSLRPSVPPSFSPSLPGFPLACLLAPHAYLLLILACLLAPHTCLLACSSYLLACLRLTLVLRVGVRSTQREHTQSWSTSSCASASSPRSCLAFTAHRRPTHASPRVGPRRRTTTTPWPWTRDPRGRPTAA